MVSSVKFNGLRLKYSMTEESYVNVGKKELEWGSANLVSRVLVGR